jgi:hypothetical protein
MLETAMLPSIERMGAKFVEGMWAIDFQPRHFTKWRGEWIKGELLGAVVRF